MVPKASLQQYADRFLNTDVAVIANNQTHAVLAIRVSLETIASNHHLLRDLSDISGQARLEGPPPAAQPASNVRSNRRWIAPMVAGVVCWSVIIGAINFRANASDNPIEVSSAQLLTPQVHAGGEIVQLMVERRRRECAITVDRVFIRKSDGVAVFTERVPGMIHAESAEAVSFKIAVAIPRNFQPGEYIYRSTIHSHCGARDGGSFIAHKPDLNFEVLPRASDVSARGRRG